MSGIDSIPVRVEGGAAEAFRTENLRPLLLQVEQALRDLVENGTDTVIDLSAMPFSAQDEADLRRELAVGEVSARVDAFGPSLIQETGVAGVWLIEHQDADGKRLMLHLEITRIPSLLVTPPEDIGDALAALVSRRSGGVGGNS